MNVNPPQVQINFFGVPRVHLVYDRNECETEASDAEEKPIPVPIEAQTYDAYLFSREEVIEQIRRILRPVSFLYEPNYSPTQTVLLASHEQARLRTIIFAITPTTNPRNPQRVDLEAQNFMFTRDLLLGRVFLMTNDLIFFRLTHSLFERMNITNPHLMPELGQYDIYLRNCFIFSRSQRKLFKRVRNLRTAIVQRISRTESHRFNSVDEYLRSFIASMEAFHPYRLI